MSKFIYPKWNDIHNQCSELCNRMRNEYYYPYTIIGLSRGGVIPARLFADFYNVKQHFYILDVELYDNNRQRKESPIIRNFNVKLDHHEVLIVDDIWDSGTTIKHVSNYIKQNNENVSIETVTLYWKNMSKEKPSYYFSEVNEDEWVVFPWEYTEMATEILEDKFKFDWNKN